MDVKLQVAIIAAVSALGGAFLGWLLKEASEYFQRRRSFGSVINRAIFNLVSIWSILMKLSRVDEFVRIYCEIIDKKYQKLSEDERTNLDKHLKQAVFEFLSIDTQDQEIDTIKRYGETIQVLAETDPILAVELKNNVTRINHLVWLDGEMKQWIIQNRQESSIQNMDASIAKMKAMLLNELADDLEDVVLDLSRNMGWRRSRRIRTSLKENRAIDRDQVEELVDRIASQLIEQGLIHPQTPSS